VLTVTFSPGLDAAAAGRSRANALKAELYAVFMDGNTPQQLTLTLSVADCQCCPGLFIPGGEYEDIGTREALPEGTNTANDDGSAAHALLTSTANNGFGNRKTGFGLCYYYRDANTSGTGSGAVTGYSWNSARTICQNIQGIDAVDAHADWRRPNLGELAQIGQLVSSNLSGTINAGMGSQAEINKAISQTSPNYHQYGSLPAGTVTANGTYNMSTSNYYWSSMVRTTNYGWSWDYNTGARRALSPNMSYGYYVRCVRKF
jgi:hypothetical protein